MAGQPIVVNQSTTLVQVDTSVILPVGANYVVFLSSVNTPGSLVTIRDIGGSAKDRPITISTTKDVGFLDFGNGNLSNILVINQH